MNGFKLPVVVMVRQCYFLAGGILDFFHLKLENVLQISALPELLFLEMWESLGKFINSFDSKCMVRLLFGLPSR